MPKSEVTGFNREAEQSVKKQHAKAMEINRKDIDVNNVTKMNFKQYDNALGRFMRKALSITSIRLLLNN